jgi:hypothetical protein
MILGPPLSMNERVLVAKRGQQERGKKPVNAARLPTNPGAGFLSSFENMKSKKKQAGQSEGLLARTEAKTQHASRPAVACLSLLASLLHHQHRRQHRQAGRPARPSALSPDARCCRAARAAACSQRQQARILYTSTCGVACASLIPSG